MVQVEARATQLGRADIELEQQLRDALDDAQDVLQHTNDAFDTTIPTDAEHDSLPDLVSPDPRRDEEHADDDASYVAVTSEEVDHACGDLLQTAETGDTTDGLEQHKLHLLPTRTPLSAPEDVASPIDQLSALRKRLLQIRSAAALPETATVNAPSEAVAQTAVIRKTPDFAVEHEDLKEHVPVSPVIQTSDIGVVNKQTIEKPELEQKSRKELQALAKAHGIKANLSSSKIIEALHACVQ